MCANFVLLANGAASNKVVDKDGKSRPPKVAFDDGFGPKAAKMTQEGRGMDRVEERGAGGRRYVHLTLVV